MDRLPDPALIERDHAALVAKQLHAAHATGTTIESRVMPGCLVTVAFELVAFVCSELDDQAAAACFAASDVRAATIEAYSRYFAEIECEDYRIEFEQAEIDAERRQVDRDWRRSVGGVAA